MLYWAATHLILLSYEGAVSAKKVSSQLGHAAFIDWNATFVACAFAEYIPELDKLHSETPQKLLFPRVWLVVSLMELMGLNNIRHH